jgi:hypothetical protein
MYFVVHVLWGNKILQSWTLNHNEGITLLHDVSSNVHILLCGYCKATKDTNIVW